MAKTSPTQRTLKYLRELGYVCAVTEHWNQWTQSRKDLFGFCDILAIHPTKPTLFVQTTSANHHSTRRNKILSIPAAKILCRRTDVRVVIISWDTTKRPAKMRHEEIAIVQFPKGTP